MPWQFYFQPQCGVIYYLSRSQCGLEASGHDPHERIRVSGEKESALALFANYNPPKIYKIMLSMFHGRTRLGDNLL